jgi:ferric-dicitrate binding protein FerR (iron transport regulator)
MNQNRQNIEEHLLLDYLLGRAPAPEKEYVERWLNEDAEHRKYLDQLEALWAETGRLTPVPLAVDVDAAWNKVFSRTTSNSRVILIRTFLSAAAVVILGLGIWFLYRLMNPPLQQVELATTDRVIADTLPDGSAITLNKNSSITYSASTRSPYREVKLHGEAVFNVTRDEDQPFLISAGQAFVKVLGTRFHVSARPGATMVVSVTEGTVQFFTVKSSSGDTISILLGPGDRAVLEPGSERPEMGKKGNPEELYWFDRSFEFNDTSLEDVFKLLRDHFGTEIRVTEKTILKCRLTSTFVNEPPEMILKIIAETFGLNLNFEQQNYVLSGKGCEGKAN